MGIHRMFSFLASMADSPAPQLRADIHITGPLNHGTLAVPKQDQRVLRDRLITSNAMTFKAPALFVLRDFKTAYPRNKCAKYQETLVGSGALPPFSKASSYPRIWSCWQHSLL